MSVTACCSFFKLGKKASKEMMIDEACGDDSVSSDRSCEWFADFKKAKFDLENKYRSSR